MRTRALLIAVSLLTSAFAIPAAARASASMSVVPVSSTLSCSNPTVLHAGPNSTEPTHGYESGIPFANHYRYNADVWTHTGSEDSYVCDQGSWTAVVTETNKQLQVRTYPDGEFTGTDWSNCSSQHALTEFASVTATYSISPPTARAKWDAAFDTYIGGGACSGSSTEVMVWEKWHGIDIPGAQLHPVLSGVQYDIFHSGSYIQVRQHKQSISGTVDLLAIWQYLASQGLISLSATHVFTQHGYEVLSTFNKPVPFTSNSFTVTVVLKSMTSTPSRRLL